MTEEDKKIKARERARLWRLEHPDYNKDYNKQYYLDNKEELKIKVKEYALNNKEKVSLNSKRYYKENKEKINERIKEWREDNPNFNRNYYLNDIENQRQRSLDYRNSHLDECKIRARKWQIENPEAVSLHAKRTKNRRKGWGFEPLNNWFVDSDFHHFHIDGNHSVGLYIPRDLHKSIPHSHNDQDSMNKINQAVINWY